MDLTELLKEFAQTSIFIPLVVFVLIGLGVVLRFLFHNENDDYRHRPDE